MMSLISSQKPAWGNIEAITYYMSWVSFLKTLMEKIGDMTYIFLYSHCLIRNLIAEKLIEEKEYNMTFEEVIIQERTLIEPCNSQSQWIPISWNVDVGMILVSEPLKLSLDYFCMTFIFQCVVIYRDKTFLTIHLSLLLLYIWFVCILTIQATLSL